MSGNTRVAVASGTPAISAGSRPELASRPKAGQRAVIFVAEAMATGNDRSHGSQPAEQPAVPCRRTAETSVTVVLLRPAIPDFVGVMVFLSARPVNEVADSRFRVRRPLGVE